MLVFKYSAKIYSQSESAKLAKHNFTRENFFIGSAPGEKEIERERGEANSQPFAKTIKNHFFVEASFDGNGNGNGNGCGNGNGNGCGNGCGSVVGPLINLFFKLLLEKAKK